MTVPVLESIRATAIEAVKEVLDGTGTRWIRIVANEVVDAVLPAVVAQVQADTDEMNAKYFHDGWVAALREIGRRGDRKVGEFLVEQLGEPDYAYREKGENNHE